ncbi:hypothetical protein F2Q70_00003960 [Brassica cretica]|uniref:Uncharacterized protein n=1 Tax=Brassica cretica TaxID=69181 RepID=A0A3N6QTB4_BRACR|nr:hypothetical protein F2Q70_00003960 [Brassica cretica]KAF3565263.1 hypothetical protein DY000_02015876 [Brassica cretica]
MNMHTGTGGDFSSPTPHVCRLLLHGFLFLTVFFRFCLERSLWFRSCLHRDSMPRSSPIVVGVLPQRGVVAIGVRCLFRVSQGGFPFRSLQSRRLMRWLSSVSKLWWWIYRSAFFGCEWSDVGAGLSTVSWRVSISVLTAEGFGGSFARRLA